MNYGPRPIEAQTWRRHHSGRGNLGAEISRTSGCQRRRRKAIMRRLWVAELMLRHQEEQGIVLGVTP